MDYFLINTLPLANKAYCILEMSPRGTERFKFKLSYGDPATAEYPPNPEWHMSPTYASRIQVPSIVDNTSRLLVVKRDVKDVLAATGVPVECFPFTLVDHKGKVASTEHFIVSPLGTFDCLALSASEVIYSKSNPGAIVEIEEFVLDPEKIATAPDLFRIKEDPETYVISHRVIEQLRPLAPSNLYLIELDVAE